MVVLRKNACLLDNIKKKVKRPFQTKITNLFQYNGKKNIKRI